ncbi:unnamed protein product [Rotaria sordida]|uniref:F-box domain-containing protein n=1 Tax=Rotaria sordida TaxID=392033 RepID=A0A819NNV6_9BILA|nr:unnamed protein product [Rotaria sordida]
MNLELLSNELLLDMFEYIHSIELIRSFYDLNKRFNNLILIHLQTFGLDFRSTSKQDFDIIFQSYLQTIKHRIFSLKLSNDDDETPEQIHLFHSYGWNFNKFPYLRSLSLNHIYFNKKTNDSLSKCFHLTNLTLIKCYFSCTQSDIHRFMNDIWSLPKLQYFYLTNHSKHIVTFPIITNCSTSIEHLSISGFIDLDCLLNHLYHNTSCLQYLALDLSSIKEQLQISIQSVNELNLVFNIHQKHKLENLLQHIPNLYRLKIEINYIEINGYEWEEIIRKYLLKLEKFQLKMNIIVTEQNNHQNLLNSFRTRFWLEEHQWFVQYHFNSNDPYQNAYIYTLPYSFTDFDIFFPSRFKSICSNDKNDCPYDYVQHLDYSYFSSKKFIKYPLNFHNINHLSITLPACLHVLLLIERCHRLTSLVITRPENMSNEDTQLYIQTLLDHIHYLHSFKFNSWSKVDHFDKKLSLNKKIIPIIMRSPPIRRINLLGCDTWFTGEQFIELSRSSFVTHCQILLIKVKQRKTIRTIINVMPNLRALVIRCQQDHFKFYYSPTQDQLLHWLKNNLSSMCLIKRNYRFIHQIHIWIHR